MVVKREIILIIFGENKGNTISDHSFGRAFDFYNVFPSWQQTERKHNNNTGIKLNSLITNRITYERQLNTLLKKLNVMPLHLIPSYMIVDATLTDEGYDTTEGLKKIYIEYPGLSLMQIKRQANYNRGFIHIGFSEDRGGEYVSTQGALKTIPANTSVAASGNPFFDTGSADSIEVKRADLFGEFKKDYIGQTGIQVDKDLIFNSLVYYGLFTPELAACFVAIAERESGFQIYTVQENYGAIGLWQVSTVPKDGGTGLGYLALPTPEETAYWKLALPERKTENLSNDQITNLINQRTAKPTPRIDLFDKRCWSLVNQISLVRSKIGFNGAKASVDGLTQRVWSWGDGYWDKGWITATKFATAAEVYTKNTRKN